MHDKGHRGETVADVDILDLFHWIIVCALAYVEVHCHAGDFHKTPSLTKLHSLVFIQ